jgi:hypothetical protein
MRTEKENYASGFAKLVRSSCLCIVTTAAAAAASICSVVVIATGLIEREVPTSTFSSGASYSDLILCNSFFKR